jgi:hypothetical protein
MGEWGNCVFVLQMGCALPDVMVSIKEAFFCSNPGVTLIVYREFNTLGERKRRPRMNNCNNLSLRNFFENHDTVCA